MADKNWKFTVTGKGDVDHALETCKEALTTLHENEHSLSSAEFEIVGLTAAESTTISLPVLLGGLGAKPTRLGAFDGEETDGWVWSQSEQQWEDPNDAGVDEPEGSEGKREQAEAAAARKRRSSGPSAPQTA